MKVLYSIPILLFWAASLQVAAVAKTKVRYAQKPINWVNITFPFQSIAIDPVLGNLSSNSQQLMQQGIELYQSEQFSQAAEVLQQAGREFHSQGNAIDEARTLNFLSLAYQKLGQLAPAKSALADSLHLLQSTSNKDKSTGYLLAIAQAYNTQGHLHLAVGKSEKALSRWQQANSIYNRSGDKAGSIGSQINQAQA